MEWIIQGRARSLLQSRKLNPFLLTFRTRPSPLNHPFFLQWLRTNLPMHCHATVGAAQQPITDRSFEQELHPPCSLHRNGPSQKEWGEGGATALPISTLAWTTRSAAQTISPSLHLIAPGAIVLFNGHSFLALLKGSEAAHCAKLCVQSRSKQRSLTWTEVCRILECRHFSCLVVCGLLEIAHPFSYYKHQDQWNANSPPPNEKVSASLQRNVAMPRKQFSLAWQWVKFSPPLQCSVFRYTLFCAKNNEGSIWKKSE